MLWAAAWLLAGAVPCRSADNSAENSAAVEAIIRFADAMEGGDAEALRGLVWIGEKAAQRQGRDAWVALAVAQRRLDKAAEARFAAEGERLRCGFDLFFPPADRKALALSHVTVDGRDVRLYREGELWPLRLRRSAEGQWQVVLDLMELDLDDDAVKPGPDALSQVRIKRMQSLAEAFTQVMERVNQGAYASAEAAEGDLIERVAAIDRDFRQQVDQLPDRYRWFQATW